MGFRLQPAPAGGGSGLATREPPRRLREGAGEGAGAPA